MTPFEKRLYEKQNPPKQLTPEEKKAEAKKSIKKGIKDVFVSLLTAVATILIEGLIVYYVVNNWLELPLTYVKSVAIMVLIRLALRDTLKL